MSLAEGIMWFLSTFLACWGTTLIVRGLRGERIRPRRPKGKPQKAKPSYRPTWKLVALGVAAVLSGMGTSWFATVVHAELTDSAAPGWITPGRMAAAGVLVFGVVLASYTWIGDRSRGRQRCPRCWYDMVGAFADNEPSIETCPECGRVVNKPAELHRTRRSRLALAGAAALLLLGSFGVYKLDAGFRAMSLIPGRVLAARLLAEGESPQWVRDEIDARTGSYNFAKQQRPKPNPVGRKLWQGWAKQLDRPNSAVQDPLDLEAIFGAQSWNTDKRGGAIPMDRLNSGWQSHGLQILEELVSEDPLAREHARGTSEGLTMLMTFALSKQPDYDPSEWGIATPTPTEEFDPPHVSEKLDAELRAVLVIDPSIIATLDELLGWRAYERFEQELLAINADVSLPNTPRSIAMGIFGAAARQSEQTRLKMIEMLEGTDTTLRVFALQALRFDQLMSGRFVTEERILSALLRFSLDLTGPPQRIATGLLFDSLADNPERIGPLITKAMTDPLVAERLLDNTRGGSGDRIPIRDYLFEQLSTSEDRDVRLVLASAEQPWIDLNGKIRPVLEKLADDPDPEIAKAAEDSLRNLQDG
ncbi:MAG: hypothetical protein ACI89L_001745 [Phycisphaerales bacterium]|jgi:hypothetical protein